MDIGCVKTPRDSFYFLEALGIGVFADGMKKYKPEEGKSVVRSIQTAVETITEYQPKFFHLTLDGEDLSGSYVLVEIMNTPTMGLRYKLAPRCQSRRRPFRPGHDPRQPARELFALRGRRVVGKFGAFP